MSLISFLAHAIAELTGRTRRPVADTTDPTIPTAAPTIAPEWIVVGLGNPGERYAATAHNVGYMAIDILATGTWHRMPGIRAHVQHTTMGGIPVVLVRSTTYMNDSGDPIAALARQWDIPADRIIVAHDELDLPAGTVRLKQGGSENGHNGLKSTSEHLGTRDYMRIRMGIGRPPAGTSITDHVLGPVEFDPTSMCDRAARGAQKIVTAGLAQAQNIIHAERD